MKEKDPSYKDIRRMKKDMRKEMHVARCYVEIRRRGSLLMGTADFKEDNPTELLIKLLQQHPGLLQYGDKIIIK